MSFFRYGKNVFLFFAKYIDLSGSTMRSWLIICSFSLVTTTNFWVLPVTSSVNQKHDIIQLEETIVTGSKTEQTLQNSATLVQVITKDEIENLGAENLGQVLENYAGLVVKRDGHGDGVQMQGLDSEYVLVLTDGQPQIGRIAGKLDLARIGVENIQRVEIVKGAASALFGSQAMGGVINVITRSKNTPLQFRLKNNLRPNNVMNNRGSFQFQKELLNGSISIDHNQAKPFDLDPEDKSTTIDGYRNLNLSSQFGYRLNEKTDLSLSGEYLKQQQNGLSNADGNNWYKRTGELDNYGLRISHSYYFRPTSRLISKFYHTTYQDISRTIYQPENVLRATNTTVQNLTKGEFLFETDFSPQHQLIFGFESGVEKLTSQRIQGNKKTIHNSSGFSQFQWRFLPKTTIVFGARLDYHTEFGQHFTPKLSTLWNLGPSLQIRASWGQGFRAPNFQNLYLDFTNPTAGYQVLGNPNLDPEYSNSWNLNMTFRESKNIYRFQSQIYRNDLTNLIEAEVIGKSAAGGSQYQYKNIASAFTAGIDTSFSIQVFEWLNFQFGHAFLRAKNKETGLDLLGRSQHNVRLQIGYQFRPLQMEVDLQARHANRWGLYDDGDYMLEEEEYAPGYWIWQLRSRKKIGQSWQINSGIDNLFNFTLPQFYTFTGRAFYLGLSLIR